MFFVRSLYPKKKLLQNKFVLPYCGYMSVSDQHQWVYICAVGGSADFKQKRVRPGTYVPRHSINFFGGACRQLDGVQRDLK